MTTITELLKSMTDEQFSYFVGVTVMEEMARRYPEVKKIEQRYLGSMAPDIVNLQADIRKACGAKEQ